MAEDHNKKKYLLLLFFIGGIIIALFSLYYWVLRVTHATIINHHIDYQVNNHPFDIIDKYYETLFYFLSIFYTAVTIIPFFISSLSYSKLLGFTVAFGALIAYIFYLNSFSSVWCFFAAVCSILVYYIVYQYEKIGVN